MAVTLGVSASGVSAAIHVTKFVLDSWSLYRSSTPPKEEAGLEQDIRFINEKLEVVLVPYLMEASEYAGHQSIATRTWVRHARDITYDVEDYFQEFVVHLVEKPPRVPSNSQARQIVVHKIRGLRERIHQMNQRYKEIRDCRRDNNTSATGDEVHDLLKVSATTRDHTLLIGREKDMSHIIQTITKDDKTRQIIPIWGMGGLGKTALTRSIYENQDIRCVFQKYAWITLSHPFNAEEFFRTLVEELQESDITLNKPLKDMQLKDLIEESNKLLQGRTYLIVLDNLSSISVSEWNSLMQHIIEEGNASRIIVTTRQKTVAENCSIDNIYKLETLEDIAAFQLFKKKVLMDTVNFEGQPEMVEQAKRILSTCNGLPLAIDTIAGFLASRPKTVPEWKKFNDQFSFEFETNPSLEMIRTVLHSSSETLPYHLKLCFLYLSIFPNDQNMRRRRLVMRWIAEGYSYGTRNRTAEENGEGFLAELISRSIIQPSESVAGGAASIDYCHVHNLLHEISVSESAKEKFSFVLQGTSNLQTKDTIRHLSITSSWKRVEDELKSIGNLSQLRSLTVCGEWQSFFISEGIGYDQSPGPGRLIWAEGLSRQAYCY